MSENLSAEAIKPVVNGRYRHFKGNEYEVVGIAKCSETLEEQVVYRCLYGAYDLWVRPLSMFMETVEQKGNTLPRFSLITKDVGE